MKLGYACINLSLGSDITTNRTLTKKTFEKLGADYVSELALKNVSDIIKILEWNLKNDIKFFRLSSDIIPRDDMVALQDLKDFEQIKNKLKEAGDFAKQNNIRITSHPGPFVVLSSPHEHVVDNSIKNLELHGFIFDLMELDKTSYNKINIHCNGVYGDKLSAMDRFCDNYNKLSDSVKNRLSIENDDKASMYSVNDLLYIHNKISIPIVFDYHHHRFCDGGITEEEALALAVSTWKNGITPVVHYSESAVDKKPQAHSDFIKTLPNTYGNDVDIMLETKMKDLALLEVKKYI